MNESHQSSNSQVLKSLFLLGSSSVADMALRVLRTKAVALILGPAGIGSLGLYSSFVDLMRSVVVLGLNHSGVGQIAEASGGDDSQRSARTVRVMYRTVLLLSLLGAVLMVVFRDVISHVFFGDDQHSTAVAVLAGAVFLGAIASGRTVFLLGMRRVADYARINVLTGFYGTLVAVPVVYLYGEGGIAPSLVAVAATWAITSWWYSRKIRLEPVRLTWAQFARDAVAMLKLGVVLMSTGLMALAVACLVRIIVIRAMGVEEAGYYQAASALGALYVGFILKALAADFYPRLSAVAKDNRECNRLVNQQAEINLLLAGPGVIGTLTFAPLVLELFYSAKFVLAVDILRWICLGVPLCVVAAPLDFVLLAKGSGRLYFWQELASYVVQIALIWPCIFAFGLVGTGVALFGSYVFDWFLLFGVARAASRFRWSATNKRIGLFYGAAVAAGFMASVVPSRPLGMVVGTLITVLTGLYSLRMLCMTVPVERLPKSLQQALLFLPWAPSKLRPAPAVRRVLGGPNSPGCVNTTETE